MEEGVVGALAVSLRPATDGDRAFLFDLFASTMAGVIQQTWGWDERWQRANFSRRFNGYDVSVIELDGRRWLHSKNGTPEPVIACSL